MLSISYGPWVSLSVSDTKYQIWKIGPKIFKHLACLLHLWFPTEHSSTSTQIELSKKGYSLIIKNGAENSSLEKRWSKRWNRVKFKIYLNNPSQYWLKQNHLYKHIQMILEYLNTGCSHLWYIYFHQKVVSIHQRLRKISHYQYTQGYIYWNFNFRTWLL